MSYAVAEVDALGERFRPWRTLAAAYLYRNPGGLTSGPRPRGVASLGDYPVCRE